MIDTNVYLSRWPFRRVRGDEPGELVELLRGQGVRQAWAGSFDALLHKDIAAVNDRLARDCQRDGEGLLLPMGAVNPTLPDWEDDLRRCHEEHRMRGIRLHPNYHGYALTEPAFNRLLRMAAERGLLVQIAARMADARTQHPRVPLKPTDLGPLPGLTAAIPNLRLVLLNAWSTVSREQVAALAKAGVSFDIATLEGIGGVEQAVASLGVGRLVFGSFAPLFHFQAAQLKMGESQLSEAQTQAILHANSSRLIGGKP